MWLMWLMKTLLSLGELINRKQVSVTRNSKPLSWKKIPDELRKKELCPRSVTHLIFEYSIDKIKPQHIIAYNVSAVSTPPAPQSWLDSTCKNRKLAFSAGHRPDSAADQCLVNIDDRRPLILLPKLCGKRCGNLLLVKNSQWLCASKSVYLASSIVWGG